MALTKRFYNLFINGKSIPPERKEYFDCINPSTGEVFASIACATKKDVDVAISAARNAFDHGQWPRLSLKERAKYLLKIANLIRKNAKELAEIETADTGKTSKQTTFIDVPTAADTFEYFGKLKDGLSPEELRINAPVKSVLQREPVGVTACIIPWNYPLVMAAWKIAPALLAGNTVIFKPSPLASASLMRLAEIIQEAGLPEGVLNFISSANVEAASRLVEHPAVDMVSFSGGCNTGREIMKSAATTTKKLILELGGKSPNIVFADCDFDAAVGGALSAIFMNQGQMCTAGSRLLLEDKVYDRFLSALVKKARDLKIGDAMQYDTDFGPVASVEHRDKILAAVQKAVGDGARILCGGKIPDGSLFSKGAYIEPTILDNVSNSMAIAREEVFGPVLCVFRFSGKDEAVKIANDSNYGLAAMVWTKDLKKADTVAQRLRCGTVWINTYGGFYNEAPFGGYKQSGFGRELGFEGLGEYTQTKHICTDQTPGGTPLVSSWF